jgi:hypothetical protein
VTCCSSGKRAIDYVPAEGEGNVAIVRRLLKVGKEGSGPIVAPLALIMRNKARRLHSLPDTRMTTITVVPLAVFCSRRHLSQYE